MNEDITIALLRSQVSTLNTHLTATEQRAERAEAERDKRALALATVVAERDALKALLADARPRMTLQNEPGLAYNLFDARKRFDALLKRIDAALREGK